MLQYRTHKKSGCLKISLWGCLALFLLLIVITVLIFISIELTEGEATKTPIRKYKVETDTLTKEKIINSSFSWGFVDNSLRKRKYEISFRLLEKDVKAAMAYIDELAKMKYSELGVQKHFTDPVTESRTVWAEVYRRIYNYSIPQMKSILSGFNKIFVDENYGANDKVYFVITFIQNITYKRPGGELDLFPPIGTLAYRFGDCDSKALLLYVILEKMGVDCAMLWSYNYKHAMLGIRVIGRGNYLAANGKKYFFLETTYPNWDIGEIPPEYGNIRYWFIEEIDFKTAQTDSTKSRRVSKPSPSKL